MVSLQPAVRWQVWSTVENDFVSFSESESVKFETAFNDDAPTATVDAFYEYDDDKTLFNVAKMRWGALPVRRSKARLKSRAALLEPPPMVHGHVTIAPRVASPASEMNSGWNTPSPATKDALMPASRNCRTSRAAGSVTPPK